MPITDDWTEAELAEFWAECGFIRPLVLAEVDETLIVVIRDAVAEGRWSDDRDPESSVVDG